MESLQSLFRHDRVQTSPVGRSVQEIAPQSSLGTKSTNTMLTAVLADENKQADSKDNTQQLRYMYRYRERVCLDQRLTKE